MLNGQIDSLKNSTGVPVKVAVQSSFSCVLPMSFDLLWLLYEGCQVLQLNVTKPPDIRIQLPYWFSFPILMLLQG